MQLRNQPFAEWVLVYFNPNEIKEEKLLALAKKEGCRNARIIRDPEVEIGKTKVQLLNPYISSGDTLILKISSLQKVKPKLTLPEGFKVDDKSLESLKGEGQIYITSEKVADGKKSLSIEIGGVKKDLKFEVVREIR